VLGAGPNEQGKPRGRGEMRKIVTRRYRGREVRDQGA